MKPQFFKYLSKCQLHCLSYAFLGGLRRVALRGCHRMSFSAFTAGGWTYFAYLVGIIKIRLLANGPIRYKYKAIAYAGHLFGMEPPCFDDHP